jgi:recombinational DNA repair ATPase RecF
LATTARKPSAEPPTSTHGHLLRRLFVLGGFLDRVNIEFAPGLNCIIGGRGTGKTTALEFIRFALDAAPEDAKAAARIDELAEHNLDSGRVELGIETKEASCARTPTVLCKNSDIDSDRCRSG